MSRILKAFIKFIEFTDITRDLLNNANDKNYNMFKTLDTLFLCSTPICIGEILHLYKLPSFLRILLYIPITVKIVRLFVTKVFKGFTLLPTKLSHFMFYGSLYTIVVFSITLEFNPKILSRSTVELFVQDFEIVNSVLIPTLVATLFWSLCSCFTATRIAIAGNAILTGIVTLLREIALVAFAFYNHIPNISTQLEENLSLAELGLYSLIYQEMKASAVDTAINTFALPPIIILGCATIICVLKDYVEKEYIAPAAYID